MSHRDVTRCAACERAAGSPAPSQEDVERAMARALAERVMRDFFRTGMRKPLSRLERYIAKMERSIRESVK